MQIPTEKELQILQILWDEGPLSVRQVHELLGQDSSSGYTTTLKLMQIMNEKGLAKRDTSSRTHIYHASVVEVETKKNLLKRFIDATFKGSATSLVLQALGSNQSDPSDLEEIKAFIKTLENQ